MILLALQGPAERGATCIIESIDLSASVEQDLHGIVKPGGFDVAATSGEVQRCLAFFRAARPSVDVSAISDEPFNGEAPIVSRRKMQRRLVVTEGVGVRVGGNFIVKVNQTCIDVTR